MVCLGDIRVNTLCKGDKDKDNNNNNNNGGDDDDDNDDNNDNNRVKPNMFDLDNGISMFLHSKCETSLISRLSYCAHGSEKAKTNSMTSFLLNRHICNYIKQKNKEIQSNAILYHRRGITKLY